MKSRNLAESFMPGPASVETFYSRDVDGEIEVLRWQGLDEHRQVFAQFQRVLAVLDEQLQFTQLSGHLALNLSSSDENGEDLQQEEWPVEPGTGRLVELAGKLETMAERWPYLSPEELVLRAAARVCLPRSAQEVRIIAYDTPDPENVGALRLAAIEAADVPPSLRAWMPIVDPTCYPEDAPLCLRLSCESSKWAQQVVLRVQSRFDLWRPTRFDGREQDRSNHEHIHRALAEIASRSGGSQGR